MKRFLLISATIAVVLSLTACTDSGNVSSANSQQSSVSSADTAQSSTEESKSDSSTENPDSTGEQSQSDGMTEQSAIDSIAELTENFERLYSVFIRCKAETEEFDYDSLPEDEQGFRYAPVSEFGSITEMKADAEKYLTAEYAKAELYSVALNEELPYYKESDGKLFVIADVVTGGENFWDATSATVLSCDNDSAVVSVEYQDNYGGEKRCEFTLVIDNGSVKIDKAVMDLSR